MNFLDHTLNKNAVDYLNTLAKSSVNTLKEHQKTLQNKQFEVDKLLEKITTIEKLNINLKEKIKKTNHGINRLVAELYSNGNKTSLREIKLAINWRYPIVLGECFIEKGAFVEKGDLLSKAEGLEFYCSCSGFVKELLKRPGDRVSSGDSIVAILLGTDS